MTGLGVIRTIAHRGLPFNVRGGEGGPDRGDWQERGGARSSGPTEAGPRPYSCTETQPWPKTGVSRYSYRLQVGEQRPNQNANSKHQNRKLISWCVEGCEKLGPVAPLSRHRGGLSDRVHLDGQSKISKQTAGCKNRSKPYPAGSGLKNASEALQTIRR